GTATVQAIVASIDSRYDLDALTHVAADRLDTNDIGRARLRLAAELPLEPYRDSRHEGSFLVIHPSDGATLAAGIVR
ncbi:sulfate adenylyltransferase, partial [Microbacterium sp. HMWF026]